MHLYVFSLTCLGDGAGGIALAVLNYFSNAFMFYVSGFAMANNNIYYSFLLGHVFLAAWYVWWCLSTQFPQPQPLCSFTDPVNLLQYRQAGMPSLTALLTTCWVTFLLGKQILGEGGLPASLQIYLLIGFPLWLVGEYISRNATGLQVLIGFAVGFILAVFFLVMFHYVAREFYRSLCFLPLVGGFFPLVSDKTTNEPPEVQDLQDQDLLMLFPRKDARA